MTHFHRPPPPSHLHVGNTQTPTDGRLMILSGSGSAVGTEKCSDPSCCSVSLRNQMFLKSVQLRLKHDVPEMLLKVNDINNIKIKQQQANDWFLIFIFFFFSKIEVDISKMFKMVLLLMCCFRNDTNSNAEKKN